MITGDVGGARSLIIGTGYRAYVAARRHHHREVRKP
jgi:hypothetical protein